MSYNCVGLSTPWGSGTSGYVQSNRFQTKSKPAAVAAAADASPSSVKADEIKKSMGKEIAEHERKRMIQSELLVISETLADQGYTEAEIAEKVREARNALEASQRPIIDAEFAANRC